MRCPSYVTRVLGVLLSLACTAAFGAAADARREDGKPMTAETRPIVIAHRGASGYLPEHTLPAKALAHGMGADFLEQDIVLTKDAVPIVLHDILLDSTTNVATVFPDRARADGHFYAIDFTLTEIRELRAHERRAPGEGDSTAFPARFPAGPGLSGVPTLAEEIQLIEGLNRSRGMRTGLYIELKAPQFHKAEGMDIARAVLDVLKDAGLAEASDRIYLQCFDPPTLQYLKDTLQTSLPLIQLIGDNSWGEDGDTNYDYLRTDEGLAEIARYADGIGPWILQIYSGRDESGEAMVTDLVARAHRAGLLVHPFTFRRDALPPGISTYRELLELFIGQVGVDGVFTDFPDLTVNYLESVTTP
ncbi:glycerophosphodiester phosphodiesterase [Chromatocurvus halotolerans]|uniref:glycerophosphodiester phosphodiesterase n=1 Tax=Chromatocurvus halotolerans TaxID=1132028 RepID=A0A4R2KML9_9GAMM|nr:glycerophosphodiester phosphodiesterase [Chromatocurvus halotolerans]TCO75361.1 glycerophosphoryl diester phosphodiesterase [Chromatocurvus halotolerans]